MSTLFFFWLILAVIAIIVEVMTLWVWSICLAFGAGVAAIAACYDTSFPVQIILAAGGMLIFFMAFGRFFAALYNRHRRHGQEFDSNMDEIIGRRAVVTDSSTPRALARVRIDGDNWQVELTDGKPLQSGDEIEIVGYDSIILKAHRVRTHAAETSSTD